MCLNEVVTSTVPGTLLVFNKHSLNNEADAMGVEGSMLFGPPLGTWWALMLRLFPPGWKIWQQLEIWWVCDMHCYKQSKEVKSRKFCSPTLRFAFFSEQF